MKIEDQLLAFIKEAADRRFHNKWLENKEAKVYVRKSKRFVNDAESISTLDIAAAEVHSPNNGWFSNFLNQVEVINPWDGIYIESVLTRRFCNFFLKRNYAFDKRSNPPSFFKIKDDCQLNHDCFYARLVSGEFLMGE